MPNHKDGCGTEAFEDCARGACEQGDKRKVGVSPFAIGDRVRAVGCGYLVPEGTIGEIEHIFPAAAGMAEPSYNVRFNIDGHGQIFTTRHSDLAPVAAQFIDADGNLWVAEKADGGRVRKQRAWTTAAPPELAQRLGVGHATMRLDTDITGEWALTCVGPGIGRTETLEGPGLTPCTAACRLMEMIKKWCAEPVFVDGPREQSLKQDRKALRALLGTLATEAEDGEGSMDTLRRIITERRVVTSLPAAREATLQELLDILGEAPFEAEAPLTAANTLRRLVKERAFLLEDVARWQGLVNAEKVARLEAQNELLKLKLEMR